MPNSTDKTLTRRQILLAALGLAGASSLQSVAPAKASDTLCQGDIAIDSTSALLFSQQAALTPAAGLRDARAVWSHVPAHPHRSVLVYLHGNDNYVTVDAAGKSRVPDWAAGDAAARAGAESKLSAPLAYRLADLGTLKPGGRPIVLVPEVGTLATGSFWSREPAGQYADPARLGLLVSDCLAHLVCLHRPDKRAYLAQSFAKGGLERVFVSGHSGAGLILQEAAQSAFIQPGTGSPADLWLLDCTYWSQISGFVDFCRSWQSAGRLAGGQRGAARFVCVYRPGTQTEAIADVLRGEIAKVLGVPAESLVKDHESANVETEIRPALRAQGALFLRTHTPHDDIPTLFLPLLLQTSASS